MKTKQNEASYSAIAKKGFRPALKQFMSREFPSLMGPKVLELFVDEMEKLIDTYYPRADRVKPGQLLWYAVAKEDKPSFGKSITETKLVPVILTLITPEEVQELADGKTFSELQQRLIRRLFYEADEQGGVLAYSDVSVIIRRHLSTVGKIVTDYEKETNTIVPRRGTVHDLGKSVSHKMIICKKRVLEKKNTEQISRETNHSPQDVERYTEAYRKIGYCLRKGLSAGDIAFVTSMSANLTKEYIELYKEFNGKRDDNEDCPLF